MSMKELKKKNDFQVFYKYVLLFSVQIPGTWLSGEQPYCNDSHILLHFNLIWEYL